MNYPNPQTYGQQPGPANGYAGGYPQQAPQPGYNPPSPQNYPQGQQPQPQGQQAPQAQQWTGSGDPLAAGSRGSISWEVARGVSVPPGTRRLLAVYEPAEVVQARDYDTGMPKVYPDSGQPVWQVVFGVIDENGERKGLYFGRPSAGQAALLEAQNAAGAKIEAGGLIDITFTHDKPNPEKPRNYPAKQFTAAYWKAPDCRQYMTPAQRDALDRELAGPKTPDALGQQNGAQAAPQGPPPVGGQQYAPPAQQQPGYGTQQGPPPGYGQDQQPGYPPAQQGPPPGYGQMSPQYAPAGQQPLPPAPPGGQTLAGAQQALAGAGMVAPTVPQQAPPQQAPPQQAYAQPAPQAAPAQQGPPMPGYSVGQLAALRAMKDEEIQALGHDPLQVRAAIAAASATGALPPY